MIDIRGLFPFSLVDYPGKISCIIFCGGCNFRCPFCHNPCLVFDPASQPRVTEPQLFHFLESRRNRLEGVVISGGEPTLHPGLHRLANKIRSAGFLVKLDTNGTNPEAVRRLLDDSLPDAFGIDYKAPASDYCRLTGTEPSDVAERVHRTIRMAVESGRFLDVRTTVHRDLLSPEMLAQMHGELRRLGVKHWMLQQFNPVEVIDDDLPAKPTYSDAELVRIARSLGEDVQVRGLTGRIISRD